MTPPIAPFSPSLNYSKPNHGDERGPPLPPHQHLVLFTTAGKPIRSQLLPCTCWAGSRVSAISFPTMLATFLLETSPGSWKRGSVLTISLSITQLSAQLSQESRDRACTTEDHTYTQGRPWHEATGGSRRLKRDGVAQRAWQWGSSSTMRSSPAQRDTVTRLTSGRRSQWVPRSQVTTRCPGGALAHQTWRAKGSKVGAADEPRCSPSPLLIGGYLTATQRERLLLF